MLRVSPLQHALVHGEGVGDVALANDATTRSAQGEVDPASLLRLRIADLPRLFFAKIKSNQGFFTTSKSFVERRRALLLPASFFFRPAVVLPLLPGAPFAVAAVARDSATATATKCLSLRACKRRIRLEAGHAKFCPGGSGILPATGHAAWHLGFCRQSGARQAQDRH